MKIPLPTIDVLDSITIPVTCPVSWDEMYGDRRTRFCNKCSQDVHDVSELTATQAVQLLTGGVKLPCLRVYRRQDGRVMTADCTTKPERVWKWLRRLSAPAAALFALVFWLGYTTRTQGAICFDRSPFDPHANEHRNRRVPKADSTLAVTLATEVPTEATVQHEQASDQHDAP